MIRKDIEYRYNTSNGWYINFEQYGFEEVTGRFKIGKDVRNEVWKTFLSNDETERKKAGIRMDYGGTHIWPSYRIQYIPHTFIFKAWSLSNWGHMQDTTTTGFQYPYGTFSEPKYSSCEFDPAGGYGHFKIEAKESSMWHPLAIKIRVEEGNKTEKTPEDELFSFDKKEDKWYVYDTTTQKDVVDNDARTKWNIGYTIEKESDNVEGSKRIQRFKIKKDLSNHDASAPLGQGLYDYDLWYNIGPNNSMDTSTSAIYIEGYYDERGEYHSPHEIKIGSWTQKANVLYFVNMAWVRKPRLIGAPPSPMGNKSVEYFDTSIELYLYVELGVSPNGGNDIYWNQDVPGNPLLSSRFPSDLANSVTVTISSNDPDFDATGKYSNFTVSNYGGNYLQVRGSSLPNNDHNNPSSRKTQGYYIDDVMYDPNKTTSWVPSTSQPGMVLRPRKYQITTSDTSDSNHVLHETFTVKKATSTKPWNISLTATLNYNKYKGSTDGNLAGEKRD